jgi:hypothetical protein
MVPAALHAQTLRGLVVNREGAPVSGVLMSLVDSTNGAVAQSLSNDRGEFILRAGRPGVYSVHSLRIGFRQVITPGTRLALGKFATTRIVLDDVRLQLETIRVSARSECEVRGPSAAQTFTLWDQARAALTAAILSADAPSIVATTIRYERVLARAGPRILGQTTSISSRPVSQPWQTPPLDSLLNIGYVTFHRDTITYRGPGLDMLASDEFLLSHCLRLASDSDSSRIGIAFEPMRTRRGVADVKGTLWLDRSTAELRQVEFQFTNIPREQARYAGGDARLVRMANGGWVISQWKLNMPVFALRGMPSGFYDPELILVETRVVGGELSSVTSPSANGADTLWAHEPLVMQGTVSDSLSGVPVAGAHVTLVGTELTGTTNDIGEFAIAGVLPGEYDVDVRSPKLSKIGAVSRSSVTFLESGGRVAVRIVSLDQVLASLCPRTQFRRSGIAQGLVLGNLLGTADDPRVGNVQVTVVWQETVTRGEPVGGSVERRTRYIEARTDSLGAFRLCGAPVETDLELRAVGDQVSSIPVLVRIPADLSVARVNPILDATATRTAVFTGVVMVDSTTRILPDAEIVFPDLGLATRTNAQGEFRIADVPPGSHKVVARSLGYLPLEADLTFAPNQIDERTLYLRRVTVLDSVVTTSNRQWLQSFDDNRRVGLGRFLTREELDKIEGRTMASVMGQFSGVAVKRASGGANKAWVASSRREGMNMVFPDEPYAKAACYAHVWVDGVQRYFGRDGEPLFNLADLAPTQIEAIEYYAGPSQTPGQYSGLNSNCGVVVIWMRR